MALTWCKKGVWQICMHHWTVHEKVDFLKILPESEGVYSTTFGTKLSYEAKKFIQFWGGIFNNLWYYSQ